jgi:hypothetical protein
VRELALDAESELHDFARSDATMFEPS